MLTHCWATPLDAYSCRMLGLLQVKVGLTRGDRALPSQFPDCLGQVESPEQVASSVEALGLLGIACAAL